MSSRSQEKDGQEFLRAASGRRFSEGQGQLSGVSGRRGRLVGLSERQVRRILVRCRAEGDAGLVHWARGRPSNRRLSEVVRRRVMARV